MAIDDMDVQTTARAAIRPLIEQVPDTLLSTVVVVGNKPATCKSVQISDTVMSTSRNIGFSQTFQSLLVSKCCQPGKALRNPPAPKVLGRDLPDGTRKRLQVYLGGAFFGQNLLFLIGRDARLQKTL